MNTSAVLSRKELVKWVRGDLASGSDGDDVSENAGSTRFLYSLNGIS